jgi:hypothetical protein
MPLRTLVVTGSLLAAGLASLAGTSDSAAARSGIGTCHMVHRRYHTLPDVRTAGFCLLRRASARREPGYVLITPRPGTRLRWGEQWAAMMLDDSGRVIWYASRPDRVHNLMTVRYHDRTLLALYQRSGDGWFQLLDSHYRQVARIEFGDGYRTDMHELRVTDRGTAYVDSYHRVDVPGVGRVMDWAMREIDIATHKVLFEWHALGHVPLWATYRAHQGPTVTWDYFHGNSIDPPRDGGHTIVVSSRNTSAVYGIDRRTGAVRWILGGRRDQFGLRRHPGWWFCGQHDARRQPDGTLTLFDDGGFGTRDGTGCGVHAARVPRFRMDIPHRRVRLVGMIGSGPSSPDGRGLYSSAVGSARVQPDGDTLVSWGTTGLVSEVERSGRVGFALQLQPWTYRAVRADWTGSPLGRPAVAARRSGRAVVVWASWNGATQIREWCVLAGDPPDGLRPVGGCRRFNGLETHLRVHTDKALVAVRAIDAHGHVLGTSRAVAIAP